MPLALYLHVYSLLWLYIYVHTRTSKHAAEILSAIRFLLPRTACVYGRSLSSEWLIDRVVIGMTWGGGVVYSRFPSHCHSTIAVSKSTATFLMFLHFSQSRPLFSFLWSISPKHTHTVKCSATRKTALEPLSLGEFNSIISCRSKNNNVCACSFVSSNSPGSGRICLAGFDGSCWMFPFP